MESKELFQVGDRVSECGIYKCDVCEDLGIEEKEILKQGDFFPKCSSCGDIEIWKRESSR